MLLALILAAALGSYKECQVSVGKVQSCSATWFNGNAVILNDSAYRRCQIVNGQVTSCAGWFSGIAVVEEKGRWKRCHISTGKILSCEGTSYSGTVVVRN